MLMNPLITDSLGFRLEIEVVVIPFREIGRGQHKTYERDGRVPPDAPHRITIYANPHPTPDDKELAEVIAHEAYHLMYSIRHLITVDEETEAVVFGQLVKHIHAIAGMANVHGQPLRTTKETAHD